MMRRIFSRTLQAGPRRSFAVCEAIARVFRSHIRLVVVACVVSLLVAAMFSVRRTQSAGYLRPAPLFINAPTNLVVTATTSASVSLSWTAPAGFVDHYEVVRSENKNGPFAFVSNAAGTTFNDTTVTSLHAYLYSVRAVGTGGIASASSNMMLGTAISFEFSQLQGRQVKAQHFHDVRTAINAVRAVANLPAATWVRGNLSGLDIKADDVQEMRNKLGEALTALAISIPAYDDAVLNTGANGTSIKGIHIEQLQARSTRGSSANAPSASPTPTPCSTSTHAAVVGQFDPAIIRLPIVPVHLSVLPDGRVLFWGRDKDINVDGNVKEVGGRSEAYVWNIPDGSNKTDVAVFRPSESNWYIKNSATGTTSVTQWGLSGDLPAPGDFDGDGRADLAIFRPSNGLWAIVNSSDGSVTSIDFGINGDIPVPGDYDQDGKTDLAIYRPSNGLWGIRNSKDGTVPAIGWGIPGDIAVPGDYDRDRRNDLAIYRPSEGTWYIRKSSTGTALITQFGISGDVPAPGDYNGDGATDQAVYRPSNGNFYVGNIMVPGSSQVLAVGQAPSATVQLGDYDGDGKTDPAIFRPLEGNWQIRKSSTDSIEVRSWGQNGDVPVPKDYDGMLRVANTTTNLFCSGHSFLPDGRLFVAGGHRVQHFDAAGERHTNIFDYRTNCWSRGPDMDQGRWYPYNVTLGTGETLTMSGSYWANEPGLPFNPYDPNSPLPSPSPTPDLRPNLVPQIYTPGQNLRNLSEPRLVQLTAYPYLHLTPGGKVFQAQSGFLVNSTDKKTRLLDPNVTDSLTELEETNFSHAIGTSVLFHSGSKALIVGGFNSVTSPTTEAEFIDLEAAQKKWIAMASMNFPRAYHTATILPNGKVLVTGGVTCKGTNHVDCGQVMTAEMWDPTPSLASNLEYLARIPWCKMAVYKEVRAYHSIAALLPDGKVLIGGGGLPGAVGETDENGVPIVGLDTDGDGQVDTFKDNERMYGHKTVEIYSPPYLFDANGDAAERPVITSAPASVSYGQPFSVETSGAGPAPKVSLVRLASVTHGFNQDQRQIFLNDAQVTSSGMNVTAPADPNRCPPGYYMLFVLNSDGVPSMAKIIRVQALVMSSTMSATVTSDNGYELYFNGIFKGSGSAWWQSQTYGLTMQPGKNVLAIRAIDAGGVAGLLADLTVNGQRLGSNVTWKVSLNAPANWTDVNFNDCKWVNATEYGSYGVSPWFTNVSGMPVDTFGKWIWSANNDLDDVVYIRVSFTK
jgi:hypothetical protein